MSRETVDEWCKRGILVLVSAILLYAPLALGGVRPSEFIVVQWLIAGVVGVWLIRLWVAPKYRFLLPPTAWAAVVFVAYAVWRYRTADIEYTARQEFMLVLVSAVLLAAIIDNLYGQSELRILVIALIGAATLIAMYGIYQWLTGSQHVWHFVRPGYEGRASGTYICPNHFAGFLEMIFPIATMFALLRGFGAVPRILFAYASLVILVGIAASGSRGGWLSTAIAVIVLAAVLIRRKSHIWIALTLLLAVGGTGKWMYSRAIKARIEHHAQGRAVDDLRVRLWAAAAKMWQDHPWFGVGPGHFDDRYRGYRAAKWQFQARPDRAHNDYVNTLADWGLVGLFLVLTPIGVTAFGAVRTWRYLQRRGETAGSRAGLVLGSAVGIVAILVHSFFDFNLHIPANALVAATLIAFVSAHWRFSSQQYWITARWPLRLLATVVLAGLGFYLVTEAYRHTSEVSALREAERFTAGSDKRIEALERAASIEPKNPSTTFAIGEQHWMRAMAGDEGYQQEAIKALGWFESTIRLNRWDPQPHLRMGMCLDWLVRPAEAERHFLEALRLDPNHWQTRAMMGWHYFQAEQFAEVSPWMKRSLELQAHYNPLAYTYLDLAEKALADKRREAAPK